MRITTSLLRRPSALPLLLTGAATAFQGIAAILTARWLGAEDRGVLVMAFSISSLLQLLGGLGLPISARVRLASAVRVTPFASYARAVARLYIVSAPIVAATGVAALLVLADVQEASTLGVFAGYCLLALLVFFAREALHGLGRHAAAIGGDAFAGAFQVAGVLLLNATGQLSISTFLAVGCGSLLLQACGSIVAAQRWDPRSHRHVHLPLRPLIAYSSSALVSSVTLAYLWKGDRIILGAVRNTTEVGIYGAAASLADIAWVFPIALIPLVTRQVATSSSVNGVRRWHYMAIALTAPVALAIGVMAEPLLGLLFGIEN